MRRAVSLDQINELRVSYAVVDFPEDPGESFRGITLEGNLAYTVGTFSQVSLKMKRGPQTSFFNSSSFYLNEMMELGYNQPIGQRLSVQLSGVFQRNSYPDEVRVLASQEERDAGYDSDGNGYLDAYEWLIPSEGLLRKDRLQSGSLGLLCRLGRAMDFRVTYEQGRSHSNIVAQYVDSRGNSYDYSIFNYDYRMLTASLTIGWQR
jgi:hypothetical protein